MNNPGWRAAVAAASQAFARLNDDLELPGNLIGGARRPSASGIRFAARAGEEARWPRSSSRDVVAALAALHGDGRGRALPARHGRERIVAEAYRALIEDCDPGRELARAVGFAGGESFPAPAADRLEFDDVQEAGAQGEIAIVRTAAAELLEGIAAAAFSEIVAGRAVLLFSSGGLPEAAERVVSALLDAGLPPGALALLHDDADGGLGAAVDAGRARSVRVSAEADRLEALRRRIERVPLRTSFGAGVAAAPEFATAHLSVPRSVSLEVDADADPIAAARRIARSAFGRRETLGGQRAGRIGLVRVAARCFSAFSAALLAELEAPGDRFLPAAWLDPRLPDRLETFRARGVDEGATLIHEPHGVASRSTSGRATLLRLVFTNVEPEMRLAQDLDAAPVLLLARAQGADRRGRAGPRPTEPDLEP